MALSGLGVAGFCLWFWWTRREQLRRRAQELRLALASYAATMAARELTDDALIAKYDKMVQRFTKLGETYAALVKRTAEHPNPEELKDEIDELMAELHSVDKARSGVSEVLDEAIAEATVHRQSLAKLSAETDAAINETVMLGRLGRFMWVGGVVGLIVSCAGFVRWYTQVQWYADVQTKADFEDHMAELAAKREARAEAAKGMRQLPKP